MRASRASRASEENCRISAFKTCYFFHYICWHFRFFVGIIWHSTVKYWGGGDNTGHPPPKILGGGDISPIPLGTIPMCVCVLNHFLPADWGEGGGHVPPVPPPPPPPPRKLRHWIWCWSKLKLPEDPTCPIHQCLGSGCKVSGQTFILSYCYYVCDNTENV